MPAEVKQRKKKLSEEITPGSANKQENIKVKPENVSTPTKTSSLDFKCILCALSLSMCVSLSWIVLQQNSRFSIMEEKFALLYGKTSRLSVMEEQVEKVSKKLAASEDDYRAALTTVSVASELQRDVSELRAAIESLRAEGGSASSDLQAINARFLNATETWQERMAAAVSELTALKAESGEARGEAAERVNEVERRARQLGEKLEELEDSTRRNVRAMVHAEEEDTKRAQAQLDWNTGQIQKMDENVNRLARQEEELDALLREYLPRVKECEEQLPLVEEALRSVVKLGAELSGTERRLEDVTLQVFSAEDNMLKTLNQIVSMRKEMDTLKARGSILKMKSELEVVREAVHELTMVLRGGQEDEEEEPDEEWEEPQNDAIVISY
ncbi:inhibitor of nuclear factor kappa-B kinase-interacting protein isoform X1 [Stigmatopora argus]